MRFPNPLGCLCLHVAQSSPRHNCGPRGRVRDFLTPVSPQIENPRFAPLGGESEDHWWSGADSNRRHTAFQAVALPPELPDPDCKSDRQFRPKGIDVEGRNQRSASGLMPPSRPALVVGIVGRERNLRGIGRTVRAPHQFRSQRVEKVLARELDEVNRMGGGTNAKLMVKRVE